MYIVLTWHNMGEMYTLEIGHDKYVIVDYCSTVLHLSSSMFHSLSLPPDVVFYSLTSRLENHHCWVQAASPNQPVQGSVMHAQKGVRVGTQPNVRVNQWFLSSPNDGPGFSASTAPSPTFHGSPWFSMLIKLIDWPGTMPTTHVPDINLVIAFRASCPGNISKCHTHQDMHKAKQQYMWLIETLTYGSVSLIQALSL